MNLPDFSTTTPPPSRPLLNHHCLVSNTFCFLLRDIESNRFLLHPKRDWPQPSCTAQTGSLPCLACLSCGNTASQSSAGFTTMKFPVAWFEGTSLAGERYTWPWEWDSRSKTAVSDWTFTGDALHAKKKWLLLRRMKLFNAFSLKFFEIPYDAFFAKLLNCMFYDKSFRLGKCMS